MGFYPWLPEESRRLHSQDAGNGEGRNLRH